MKLCEKCEKKLIRRNDERLTHFKQRRFCSKSCANSRTQSEKKKARSGFKIPLCVICKSEIARPLRKTGKFVGNQEWSNKKSCSSGCFKELSIRYHKSKKDKAKQTVIQLYKQYANPVDKWLTGLV